MRQRLVRAQRFALRSHTEPDASATLVADRRGDIVRRTVVLGGVAVVLVGAFGSFAAWTSLHADAPAPASLEEAMKQVA